MKVFYDLDHLPRFQNAVITIGSFDGVHRGHQRIIQQVNHLARSIDGESVVITFHPHPRQVIYPRDNSLQLITSTEEKVRLLQQYEVDNVVVVPFTIEFSQQHADEYIQKFLIEKFQPRYIVIGYDHRFGLNRQGDLNYLQWYSEQADYEVVEIAKQEVDDLSVSSTKIRKALNAADIDTANLLLGHPFPLSGNVVHGQKLGQKLGFPTANIQLEDSVKLVPPHGIYAVHVYHEEQRYGGMLYIGDRPSLADAGHRTIEVNIFDFQDNLYGKELYLEIVGFIREDARFPDLEGLKAQLAEDRKSSQQLLDRLEAQQSPVAESTASVAVVILNYNGREYLEKFLPSVFNSSYENLTVYVADNGSGDQSLAWLEEHRPEVRRIDLKKNYGYAEGYNRALRQVESDYYILLNSDLEVQPGWIEPIIRLLEEDPATAACQPKILSYENPSAFEYAGAAGGWIDYLGYPFCRGRVFDLTETDEGQYDDQQEIFWASGAAFFVRANLFHRIGGFDPDYFAHAEEIDLCWRLKRAGFKIQVVPESVVYHLGGGTLNYQAPNKAYLNFRNTLYTIWKNESGLKLCWLIPARMVLDGVAGGLFLFQGKFAHIKAIVRAHWTFLPKIGQLSRKRQHYAGLIAKAGNGLPPNERGRFYGSIVWQYYALGKKRFKSIINGSI
ncbi:bifunctional riboflavin kinase/FAD synthetase [Flavilitoribacter nigricans]|uniref:Bifunctional riboflavin kinase/FMN adenylyltransferase n=1 Tax=Flavilitoribacter nigricans (strain ATCC 23147 / DSM 23189 / NBRC 102662 / NCIMB 1420 / SS-2) TaxID=1122177 RepID=A0A2D0NA07_FLAN2|nr:bifunctional riboflavin kinase/FAD synthetase [Flavilitoribacter nigricans]PHN05200.1 riboflavin biosynthesis protein RibF [Flavilitoribacter nigricans DSM 23189 = NBRC 102662]